MVPPPPPPPIIQFNSILIYLCANLTAPEAIIIITIIMKYL
jgi:hypothetical protein